MYFANHLSCFHDKPLTAMTDLCMTGFVVMTEETIPILIHHCEFFPDHNVLDRSNEFIKTSSMLIISQHVSHMDTCPVCCKAMTSTSYRLKYDSCLHYVHLNCTNMNRDEYQIYQCMTYPWSWIICNENMFPSNYILDETKFMSALPANDLDYVNPNSMSKLLFVPFEFNEDPSYIPGFKYNPDIHFFNQISLNINFNSNDYLEDVFKNCVSEMSTSTL